MPAALGACFLGLLLLFPSYGAAAAVTWLLESTAQGNIPAPNPGNEQTACLVGDLDGDGRQDIVVAERTASPSVTVFFRRASGWERAVVDTGQLPIEAGGALADIDRDGHLDICFAGDWRSNQIWWWQNPGSLPYPAGGWTRRLIKSGGANTHHDLIFGDFTGDGVMDLAFWNQGAGGILFLATVPADPRNSGTWPHVAIFDGVNDSEGLAKADVNGDGKIDLVGGGYWFEHAGGTTFAARLVATGRSFTRSAAGQLVAGGRPEIVISSGDNTSPLTWYDWNGTSWQPHVLDATVVNGHTLELGDVDGNGLLDIFSAEMHTPGAGSAARSRIFYNQGAGSFTATTTSTGIGNHESRLADVNGDGRLDLVGKPYNFGAPGLNVWLQQSDALGTAFAPVAACLLGSGTGAAVAGVAVADYDADGYTDVAAWLQGGGVQAFRGPAWSASVLSTATLSDAVWADIDRDGDRDLVGATAGAASNVVWLANPGAGAAGAWPMQVLYSVNDAVANLQVTDLQNDGVTDIVVFAGTKIVVLSSADGVAWTPSVVANPPSGSANGWLADIDRDGDLDLGRGGLWWRNLRGSWQQLNMPGSLGNNARSWSCDIDRDGWADILSVDPQVCGTLYRANADRIGGLVAVSTKTGVGLGETRDFATLDVDRDGDLDLVLAGLDCAGAPATKLLRNDGGSMSGWPIEPVAPASRLAAADLDRDGAVDLALGAAVGDCRLAFARNLDTSGLAIDGWARHVIDDARPWGAIFTLPGDIDRDGLVDIVTGGWWYRNPGTNGGAWTRNTIGTPLNNVILVHDLDRDGDLDVFGTAGQGGSTNANLYWAENNGAGGFTVHARIAVGTGDFPQGVAIGRFGKQLQNGVVPEGIAISWHDLDNGVELLTVPATPGVTPWSLSNLSPFSLDEEIRIGDLDRDGDLDLSLGTAWLRNNGTSWTPFTVATSSLQADRHRLVDLDRDGRLDMVVGFETVNASGPVTSYRQPADPTQSWPGTVLGSVIGPMSLDTADLDLDGDLDFVVGEHMNTNFTSARLLVLENAGNGVWNQQLVYQGDEHHDGAQLVDIDNDGDLDIISIGWFHNRVMLYENLAVNGSGQSGDQVQPYLAWARSTAAQTGTIVARFSEPVDPATARNAGNYQLTPAAAVTAATLMPDGVTVQLLANTMGTGVTYELRTAGVRDLAANANDGTQAVPFMRAPWSRVETGLVSLWDFGSGPAATVYDVAPTGDPLDLEIANTAAVTRSSEAVTLLQPVRVATTGPAAKITDACRVSGEITLETWVRPATASQSGPARIATLSFDRYSRNVTLAQGLDTTGGDRYSERLRTTTTDLNGLPTAATSSSAINLALQHVVLTRGADLVIRIYVDGVLRFTETRTGNLGNWDSTHGFAVGGEYTFDPTVCWLGALHMVAVYNRALTAAEVFQNMAAGAAPTPLVVVDAALPALPVSLLGKVSPNPFNAQVTFEVALAQATPLNLVVYDLRGLQVRRLISGLVLEPGPRAITWDGLDDRGKKCASGTYFVRAWTAEEIDIRKIMLVK